MHVPPGGLHGFHNESGPASMLLHFAPGAPREAYFEGLARVAAGETMTDQERDEFMRYHDNYWRRLTGPLRAGVGTASRTVGSSRSSPARSAMRAIR